MSINLPDILHLDVERVYTPVCSNTCIYKTVFLKF